MQMMLEVRDRFEEPHPPLSFPAFVQLELGQGVDFGVLGCTRNHHNARIACLEACGNGSKRHRNTAPRELAATR